VTQPVYVGTSVCDDFFAILTDRNIAWCVSESAGRYPYAEAITADFLYLRLHGRENLYALSYTDDELMELSRKIRVGGKETFVYFDNDMRVLPRTTHLPLSKC